MSLAAAWVTQLSRDEQVDGALLATRADLVEYLSGSPGARLGQGWRAQLVGVPVRRLADGKASLALDGHGRLLLEARRASRWASSRLWALRRNPSALTSNKRRREAAVTGTGDRTLRRARRGSSRAGAVRAQVDAEREYPPIEDGGRITDHGVVHVVDARLLQEALAFGAFDWWQATLADCLGPFPEAGEHGFDVKLLCHELMLGPQPPGLGPWPAAGDRGRGETTLSS